MLVLLLRNVILMHVSSLVTPYSSFLHLFVSKSLFMRFVKILEMEENAYQLFQHELEVHEVMNVHHKERVFPSIYPCSEFMNAAGILQDFQTLISNAGLAHFIDDEPHQYVKLTMSMVQDFKFSWSTSNPMVHYKIYNKSVDLPFDVFCAAIRVP
jgi:hypothetical protein